jgi:hypothetical protein
MAKHWRFVGEIRIAATVGSAGCGGRACGFKSSQRLFSTHGNNNKIIIITKNITTTNNKNK